MAKERMINTRFWNDGWIRKINPLDRYLFLYLLTNEYTNISGIYELPLETIAYSTGIDERDLSQTMLPRLEPKVLYKEGWIILTNFPKHQRLNNKSIVEGISRELQSVPPIVLEYAKNKGYFNIFGDEGGMRGGSSHILNLTKLNLTKLNKGENNLKTMEQELTYDYSLEGNKKRKFTKVDDKTNKTFIAIGCLWVDMLMKKFAMSQEEIPVKNLVLVIRRLWEREKWGYEEYKKLFTYFLESKLPDEDKISFDLCMSQKYVAKFKMAIKGKNKTFAGISNEIKL